MRLPFFKRLAALLSTKWGFDYSVVMGWHRCCLSFSLLCSAIQGIHGAHSSIGVYSWTPPPVDLVAVESHMSVLHVNSSLLLWISCPLKNPVLRNHKHLKFILYTQHDRSYGISQRT